MLGVEYRFAKVAIDDIRINIDTIHALCRISKGLVFYCKSLVLPTGHCVMVNRNTTTALVKNNINAHLSLHHLCATTSWKDWVGVMHARFVHPSRGPLNVEVCTILLVVSLAKCWNSCVSTIIAAASLSPDQGPEFILCWFFPCEFAYTTLAC